MMIENRFFFEKQHSDIREQLIAFRTAHKDKLEEEREDEEAHSLEVVRELGTAKLLELVVPASHGGRFEKLDVRSLCLAREYLCYTSSLADLMFGMQGLGSYPITLAGSSDLRSKYLPAVARGELVAGFAITEPEAGSDVGSLQTTATRDGDSYLLNGTKRFISNAGVADFYTVFARTGEGNRGITAFVVDAETAGFSISKRLKMISPHPIGEVSFTDCRVSSRQILGEPGEGFKLAMRTLDTFRASVGAAALGLGSRALDEGVSYAKRRKQFGRSLSEFQATQFKLAEMATELDAARLLVYRAAWLQDSGATRITREAAMAKLYATEAAQRAIDQSLQIHGGNGLVHGSVTERLYRSIRATRIYEGTSEIQKLVIAGQLLKE
jgi:acyl-CoA dehydrogenase